MSRRSPSGAKKAAAETGSSATLSWEQTKRGLIAGVGAWFVPGLGHLLAGARRRALVFFVLVVGTIGLGLAYDGNLSMVDPQRAPVLTRLQVLGNIALGPVEPLMRGALYGGLVYSDPGRDRRTPDQQTILERREQRTLAPSSNYGTAYLMLAGLMNILLILDAWDLGIGRKA